MRPMLPDSPKWRENAQRAASRGQKTVLARTSVSSVKPAPKLKCTHSPEDPVAEPTGSANSCHISSPLAHWPCYHSPGSTTMWQVCFAVFVIPTPVITALAIVEILVYGGDL